MANSNTMYIISNLFYILQADGDFTKIRLHCCLSIKIRATIQNL